MGNTFNRRLNRATFLYYPPSQKHYHISTCHLGIKVFDDTDDYNSWNQSVHIPLLNL